MRSPEERLKELNIDLPSKIDLRHTNFVPVTQNGNMLFLSGHHYRNEAGEMIYEGKLGQDVTVEQGYEAARMVGINMLRTLKDFLGSLDRVERILKVNGFVSSAPDFYQQPAVMHGFSDLMNEVFGEKGRHARSAVGAPCLPSNLCVEVEMIVKIKE